MRAHRRGTTHAAWGRRVLLLSLSLATGCSLVGVRGPPTPSDDPGPPRCTTSNAAPALDAIAGVPLLAGGVIAAVNATTCHRDPNAVFDLCPSDRGSVTASALVVAVAGAALVASAIHGFNQTAACREVLAARERACADGVAAACVTWEDLKDVPPGASPLPHASTGGAPPSDETPVRLTVCVGDLDCAESGGICYEGRCRALSR